jgi:hypothetical protein
MGAQLRRLALKYLFSYLRFILLGLFKGDAAARKYELQRSNKFATEVLCRTQVEKSDGVNP